MTMTVQDVVSPSAKRAKASPRAAGAVSGYPLLEDPPPRGLLEDDSLPYCTLLPSHHPYQVSGYQDYREFCLEQVSSR